MVRDLWQGFGRLLVAFVVGTFATAALGQSFVNFESGHVRPLAMSPDGNRVFAVNTPDNRLAIFDVVGATLGLVAEVPVGLEPVAVAARTNGGGDVEVWVVNHLSDSVSIVEIDAVDVTQSRVVATLYVGDEPRDVVFGGTGNGRAFVTAAHRGQNRPGNPQITTEGIGRADVWVFDADAPGSGPLTSALTIVTLFTDTPRALAVSADGASVYAAGFHSGSQTTSVLEPVVSAGATPTKPVDPIGTYPAAPATGLIVKFDPISGEWRDELDQDWSAVVQFDLPDFDVFRIDANAPTPSVVDSIPGVGTILFNMAVNPANGKVYVTNLESRNHVRFEGMDPIEGALTQGVKGHIAESRISIIDGTTVTARHLNDHIDYLAVPGDQDEIDETLAFPLDLTFSSSGTTVYAVAFGSEKVAVLPTAMLEGGGPIMKQTIDVGGGPSGVVLDESRNRLYVMSRFTQRVNVVDLGAMAVSDAVSLNFDPSPSVVQAGRRFLYDALRTSGHGDAACASCHIFGDFDSLAWDLGDPEGTTSPNPNPFVSGGPGNDFHPLKGPMTTQSLRGMANHGPMHWRGDRTGGAIGQDPLDEDLAFKAFNGAFPGLLGRDSQLTDNELQKFTDFALTVHYPPNPLRALDNSKFTYWKTGVPGGDFDDGEFFYFNTPTDGGSTCNGCHVVDLNAGFFGTDGRSTFEGETQEFKVPHLRNMYQKVGMFGIPSAGAIPGGGFTGDQVRGFGVLHDGGVDTLFRFISATVFAFPGTPAQQDALRREVEEFMLTLDAGVAPIVGQQLTVGPATFPEPSVHARHALMVTRADAGDCDLISNGILGGVRRGALYLGSNQWRTDLAADPLVGTSFVLGLSAGTSAAADVTYTCVPPGLGTRMGIDRDEDGFFDSDEVAAGSNPADPLSVPGGPNLVTVATTSLTMKDDTVEPANPSRRKLRFKSVTKKEPIANRIVPPAFGAPGDPFIEGATLHVYNANGSGEHVTIALGSSKWTRTGSSGYKFKDTTPDAPVKTVLLKSDKLIVKGGKANFDYDLDEPSQGRVVVRLVLGSTIEWCAEARGKTSGNPPSTAKNDRQDRFKGERKTAAPAACPAPPIG